MRKMLLILCLALPVLGAEDMPCGPYEHPAETPFGVATCTENRTDDALILAMKFGDRAALERLQQRHDTAFTWEERHRIAGALLHHVSDDGVYWNELYEHAENAVRFARKQNDPNPEFEAWCAERGFDPVEYHSLAWNAFIRIENDCRSHALLIHALTSEDQFIAALAVIGLAAQHDEGSLPLIDQVLRRSPDSAWSIASALSAFYSDAADAIATPYLLANQIEEYEEARDETGPLVDCLSGRAPRHLLDHAPCADFELNSVLIAAAGRGERTAIKQLTQRYETTTTLAEQHRIATALLRRVDDDSVYWNELVPHAEIAVALVETPEWPTWCAERGFDADVYEQVVVSALVSVRSDPRARPLLMRALDDAPDYHIVGLAIMGLGAQHDETALPAIERAIERLDRSDVPWTLFTFHGGAADAVARRHLDAIEYELYEDTRDAVCREAAQ